MNETTIKGLKMIREGIDLILEAVDGASIPVNTTPEKATKVSKTAVAEKSTDTTSEVSEYSREELDAMTYNDLKKLAKSLGITAVGNRDEITEKILGGDAVESKDEEPAEDDKIVASKKTAKVSKKKPEPEPEEDEDEDEEPEEAEDDDEEEVDEIEQQVIEATEDMDDDEIRELLDSIGVNSKGKRQSLISKLVQAVNDGKIDLDDNDDEEDDSSADEVSDDDTDNEVKAEDITESMTKKRKKAYIKFCEETEQSFEDGEITRKDLIDFINEFNGTDDKMKKVSDEDLISEYEQLASNLIDDDGNIVEEGAYTINDVPYCCGKPLKYDEEENKFICEVCGEEYEGEEG
jgi:hypothetical protein